MAIPTYEDIMLPLLQFAADGRVHSNQEAIAYLAKYFKLTEEERKQLLPSGRTTVFYDRMTWAKTYLTKAKLLESTQKGHFKITQRGIDVINSQPSKIDRKVLSQYPEFVAFVTRTRGLGELTLNENTMKLINDDFVSLTPEEAIEKAYQDIKEKVTDELLEQVKNVTPAFFERLVIDLLLKMGYGGSFEEAGEVLGQSGDGGIDGIIKEDRLGLDSIYIQAKRWNSDRPVSAPEVRKFIGSLEVKNATKGVFITTSNFSVDAMQEAQQVKNKKIILIDGDQLAQFMYEYDIGVSKIKSYEIKAIDHDYFYEE